MSNTATMTLTNFLYARIADDEAASRPGPEPQSWCDRAEGVHYEHARVLAECEAKWRIVEAYDQLGGGLVDQPMATAFGVACMALATVYADHPDYQDGWRP